MSLMQPTASRVVRERLGRWSAWVLLPGGPWFFVGNYWTRDGARRELDGFIRDVRKRW